VGSDVVRSVRLLRYVDPSLSGQESVVRFAFEATDRLCLKPARFDQVWMVRASPQHFVSATEGVSGCYFLPGSHGAVHLLIACRSLLRNTLLGSGAPASMAALNATFGAS